MGIEDSCLTCFRRSYLGVATALVQRRKTEGALPLLLRSSDCRPCTFGIYSRLSPCEIWGLSTLTAEFSASFCTCMFPAPHLGSRHVIISFILRNGTWFIVDSMKCFACSGSVT